MKKEFMASILTVTAGMAGTVTFPQYSLAQSNYQAEKSFAKRFRLQLDKPARYKNQDGIYLTGRIYLDIKQERLTPSKQNKLHGEMVGTLYFQSDDYTSEFGGKKYKTAMALMGDDGFGLLDLIHKDSKDGSTYQLYGCNSTLTYCDPAATEVTFQTDNSVEMNITLSEATNVQILVDVFRIDPVTGEKTLQKEWVNGSRNLNMNEVEIKD